MNFLLFKSRALDGEFGKILTDLFVRDSIFVISLYTNIRWTLSAFPI